MEKTINEYLSKLKKLAEQARTDGHPGVSIFIEKLISTENVEIRVYDLIFHYFDMLQDDDMDVYMFLLENGADASWYEFAEFLSDQRGSVIDYLPILSNCLANEIGIDELHDIEKNSKNITEFRTLVDAKIEAKIPCIKKTEPIDTAGQISIEQDYIVYLKAENAQLKEKLNNVMDEVNGYRIEQKNMMETSISNKKEFMVHKIETEHLKKDISKITFKLEMAEKKAEKCQEMIRQLNSINDKVIAEKSKAEETIAELQTKLDSVKDDYIREKAENGVFVKQIETLEQQISNLRISKMEKSDVNEDIASIIDDQIENYEFELSVDDLNVSKTDLPEESYTEKEEIDYNPEDLIPIQNNKKKIEKHSNFIFRLFSRHFEKKYENKSQAEQDNLIFIKLMENEFSKEIVQIVKKSLRSNNSLSRLELYKLISNKAEDDDIIGFCDGVL